MRWLRDNRLAVIGLAALFVVTAVLVGFALRPVQAPGSDGPPYTPPPTNSPTARESPAEEPSPSESASEEPTEEPTDEATAESPEPVPTTRLLTAASGDRAWRASVGSCEGPGALETSADGGESWDAVDPGLGPIVRIKALDEDTVFAIGGDAECTPNFQISTSAGAQWQELNGELGGSWYTEPADRNTIMGPGGEAAPCEADLVDFAGLSNTVAMVLCTDGDLQSTTDSGASWSSVGSAEGAMAITPQLDPNSEVQSYLLASLDADCDGVAMRVIGTSGGGASDEPTGCAEVEGPEPGGVAVALTDETAWLWAGDEVRVSTDGGASW